jgi:4-hydroxy-tetrahydrodipicolinate synthase
MADSLFEGSGVALVTPFAPAGVDDEPFRELIRFHLREGTDAFIVNGSTGEAAVMSLEEQRRTVELAVEEVRRSARKTPVIAGVGGSDTRVAERLAAQAAEAGADAILLAPPPYNKPSQAGIVAHFRKVLDATDLPMIIYNIPGRTACNILPATVETLASDPRVAGVKEASGDIAQIGDLARRVGDRVAIYSGNDDQIVPVLALGGRGVISVLANVAPGDTARMVRSFLGGDVAGARSLQFRYLPLVQALFCEPNPGPVKAALGLLGFPVGAPRLPLLEVEEPTLERIAEALRDVGLLAPGVKAYD